MSLPVAVAAEAAARVARELNVPLLPWRALIHLDLGGSAQNLEKFLISEPVKTDMRVRYKILRYLGAHLFSEKEVSIGRVVFVNEQ